MDAAPRPQLLAMPHGVPAPPAPVDSESAPASRIMSKPSKKPRERWTPAEHARFLEGLKMYHRDWRSIEKHVATKTAVQIRSHAQKFFAKAEREPGTVDFDLPPPRPKRKPGSSQHHGSGSKPGTSTLGQSSLLPNSSTPRGSTMPSCPPPSTEMHTLLPQSQQPPYQAQQQQPPPHPMAPIQHAVSADLMSKIAAAAIAAASTTARAVISAAGPEYVHVIQDLAKRDRRLSFLSCPISELVSSFVAPAPETMPIETTQAPAFYAPGNTALMAPSPGAPMYSSCQGAFPANQTFGTSSPVGAMTSAAHPTPSLSGLPGTSTMSEPPVQLLNRLLSVPPASSQFLTDPDLGNHSDFRRLHSQGTALAAPPVTSGGLSENMFLPQLDDSMCLASAVADMGTQGTPLATFTAPPDPAPSMATAAHRTPGVPAGAPGYFQSPEAHPQSVQQPVSGQVQSIQHAVPADPQKVIRNEAQARQQVQEQQLHQQHVFPKQPSRTPELPEVTNGYGEQGSGGGSGGNSGGENPGSGDKSGSKSAKQSGNRKTDEPAPPTPQEALPEANPEQSLPFGSMANMNILQGQGCLTPAQRTEFYKQYYQEMIRRGAEGLRNMNAPVEQGPAPAIQATAIEAGKTAAAVGLPPANAGVSVKRSGGGQEGCACSGHKKQRTGDTPDMVKAALSNGCEQPAAVLGMVPCPPDTNLLPLEPGRVLEFHKGTGWAIEVEQQDTATSPQGASHGCTTHPDTTNRVHTSARMPLPEASNGEPAEAGNQPNSSGEGSNEPGVNGDDSPSGGAPLQAEPLEDGQPDGKVKTAPAPQDVPPVLSRGS